MLWSQEAPGAVCRPGFSFQGVPASHGLIRPDVRTNSGLSTLSLNSTERINCTSITFHLLIYAFYEHCFPKDSSPTPKHNRQPFPREWNRSPWRLSGVIPTPALSPRCASEAVPRRRHQSGRLPNPSCSDASGAEQTQKLPSTWAKISLRQCLVSVGAAFPPPPHLQPHMVSCAYWRLPQ